MTNENSNSLPKIPVKGTVHAQWVRCGKPNCRCHEGHKHGPYYHLFWREGGRLRKRYLKPAEVAEVRAACEARRANQRLLKDMWEEFRSIRKQIRSWRNDEFTD